MICLQIKRGTTWFFKVALLKSNMPPACSSAEQHDARHVPLQSNMLLGMLFFCRATCRSVCYLDWGFVLTADVCFFCVTTEWCFIWKRHCKLNHMYLFVFCMTDRQIEKQTAQTDTHADRQTNRQTDRTTDRQTDRQAGCQAGRCAGRVHVCNYEYFNKQV